MWRLLQLLCPPLVENSLSHLMLSAANLFLSILSGSIMIWASSCTIMAFSPIRSGEWYSQWWRRLARISFGKLNIIFYHCLFFYFSFMTLIVSKKKLQMSRWERCRRGHKYKLYNYFKDIRGLDDVEFVKTKWHLDWMGSNNTIGRCWVTLRVLRSFR